MNGDNGKEFLNPKEIIEAMVKFMNNTNTILADLQRQINNQRVDIEKLKKHDKNRILT